MVLIFVFTVLSLYIFSWKFHWLSDSYLAFLVSSIVYVVLRWTWICTGFLYFIVEKWPVLWFLKLIVRVFFFNRWEKITLMHMEFLKILWKIIFHGNGYPCVCVSMECVLWNEEETYWYNSKKLHFLYWMWLWTCNHNAIYESEVR